MPRFAFRRVLLILATLSLLAAACSSTADDGATATGDDVEDSTDTGETTDSTEDDAFETVPALDGPVDPEAISHHLVMATDEMTAAYFPEPLANSVRLFAASNTDPALTIDRWSPLTAELRVDHLEGDHHGDDGIGSPKRVGVAARLVEDEIERAKR